MGGRGGSSRGLKYQRTLKAAEDRIKNDGVETAVLIDDNGTVIIDKSDGQKASVSFTADECKRMKGNTLTHNHPRGSTFSKEDLDMLTAYDLKAIRATSKNVTYEMRRTGIFNNNRKNLSADFAAASKANTKACDKEWAKVEKDAKAGKLTWKQYQDAAANLNTKLNQMNSDWLTQNAHKYGYKYSVIK